MEKLDHHHIVKLVGTYCLRNCELYLLLWPVAVCNLDNLFNDLDALRLGLGDREDIIKRLGALELTDLSAVEKTGLKPQPSAAQLSCPLAYLRRIMGCIAHAVAYCHNANIRHVSLSAPVLTPPPYVLTFVSQARSQALQHPPQPRGQRLPSRLRYC